MMYRILPKDTQALLIDMQEKLIPHIDNYEVIIKNAKTLIQGLSALNVPLIINEQYPKGLGNTIPDIKNVFNKNLENNILEKNTFSSCDDEITFQKIKQNNRPVVLLFGIETHICVLQTAMDLLQLGFTPVVVADATGSRTAQNKHLALKRMIQQGVIVVSTEMILFELCQSSKNPAFKTISALVK